MNAVDTNVLVYAVSADELVKGPVALQLLDGFSASDNFRLGLNRFRYTILIPLAG